MEVKPGYKQTEVGVIPQEWEVRHIASMKFDISDGNYSSKYPKASDFRLIGVPFIRANNIRDTTVVDDDMRFISKAQHEELQKGHLKANDVLITTRGDIGQIALVPDRHVDSNINAQLVRINTGSTGVDHRFLVYAICSASAQEQLNNLQTGSALKQLPVGRLIQLRLVFPSQAEQRAIAGALSDVDALLGALDQLIAKKRDLKQAAMQQLLTGQTRLPGFHGEWLVKRLGELLDYEQPTKYLVKDSEYSDANDLPVLTAGKTFILGYTNEKNGIYDDLPAIIFDDFTTAIKYVTFPFKAKSSAMKILKPRDKAINLRLIFEIMQSIEFKLGDHKRYWISEYQHLPIKFPGAKEQTAIAEVLTDMDAELAALEQRRAKTRALKQGMMQELLTGRTRLL